MGSGTPPPTVSVPAGAEASRLWLQRHAKALFLVALVLVLISIPVVEQHALRSVVEPLQLTVVLLGGLWVVSERHRTLVIGLALATPALFASWLDHFRPEAVPDWAFGAPAVAFCLLVVAGVLRFILRARHIDSEVLCAGVAGYLLLGLLWTFAYVLLAVLVPGAFAFPASSSGAAAMSGFTALYFSFVTLTTVGFGDVLPVSPAARMLAISESTLGVFYTTILIARLVTLYSGDQERGPSNDAGSNVER